MTGLIPIRGFMCIHFLGVSLMAASALWGAEAPIEPLRVCEVLENLAAHDGKVVAIQGRYSFRTSGRFLSEESCARQLESGGSIWQSALEVALDPKATLPVPNNFEYNSAVVYRNLRIIQRHTSLGRFRFGSVEYDRWAVIYGRVAVDKGFKAGTRPTTASRGSFDPAPARIICPGESMILMLAEPER